MFKVENGLFYYGNEIVPLDKIDSVGSFKETIYDGKLFPIIGLIFGLLSFLGLMWSLLYLALWGAYWALLVPSVLLGISFWSFKSCKKLRHGLKVTTAAGTSTAFYSENAEFVENVMKLFQTILSDDNRENAKTTINVENFTIDEVSYRDNSVTNITNNYQFDIVNSYYEGVSKEDLKFLNNQFKEGIQELAKQIQKTNDGPLNAALEEFRKEVNAERPESGRINSCWEHIKKCSDGMDIYQNVIGAGTLVSGAIAAFI